MAQNSTKRGIPAGVYERLQYLLLLVTRSMPPFRVLERSLTPQEFDSVRDASMVVPRPASLAITLYMQLRGCSQPRAIVELAVANDLLSEAECRYLLGQLGEETEPPPTGRPKWDRSTGQLRLQGQVIRKVRVAVAKNIVTILDAFEEDGWPISIDNPLPGDQATSAHEAVHSLNERLQGIKFHVEGGVETIFWTTS